MTPVAPTECERFGHLPTMTLTNVTANPPITSYITTCRRCGAAVEVTIEQAPRRGLRAVE